MRALSTWRACASDGRVNDDSIKTIGFLRERGKKGGWVGLEEEIRRRGSDRKQQGRKPES